MRILFNVLSVLLVLGGLFGLIGDGGLIAVAVLAIGMAGTALGAYKRGA